MPNRPTSRVALAVAVVVLLVGGLIAARQLGDTSSSPARAAVDAGATSPATGSGRATGSGASAAGISASPGGAAPGNGMAGGAQGASGTGAAGVRSALKGASANGTLASAACVPAGGVTVAAPVTWRDPQITVHVPILMYHRVVPTSQAGDSLPSLVVAPSLFEAQMAALHAAGWHSVTLRQLAADMAAGRVEPPRTFVATFDDGYRDGYRYAFPALRRYGFVGTYFVISGRVGMSAYLTPAELCALTRAGDEIGNHSVHHLALAGLSLAGASSEIADATRAIQAWTGVRPDTLAYPFGSWSFPVVSIVQRDGYAAAVTTAPGATETAGLRLLMPRVRVGPGTTAADLLAIVTRVGTP